MLSEFRSDLKARSTNFRRCRTESAQYEADIEDDLQELGPSVGDKEHSHAAPKQRVTENLFEINEAEGDTLISDVVSTLPLACEFPGCTKTFKKEAHKRQHESVHTGERLYICQFPDCQKAFTRPYHLKRHQSIHSVEECKRYSCTVPNCQVICSSSYGLKKHIERKHHGPLKCDFPGCPQTFQSQKYLTAHQREHTEEEHAHKCSYANCGKSFRYLSKLKKHMQKHQGYVCEEDSCGKVCATFGEMRSHYKIAHTVIECEICGKTFSSKYSKKQHLSTHSDVKDRQLVPCTEEGCTKVFTTERIMKNHILLAHGNAEKLKCTIEGCKQTFVTKHTLARHLKNHEAIELQYKRRLKNRKKKMKKRRKQTRIVTSNLTKITGFLPDISNYIPTDTCTESEAETTGREYPKKDSSTSVKSLPTIENRTTSEEHRTSISNDDFSTNVNSDSGHIVVDSDIFTSSDDDQNTEHR